MKDQKLAGQIVDLCLDNDSFLVLLHSFSFFNEDKFHELLSLIEKYSEEMKNKDQVHREVVGCLLNLMIVLDNAIISFKEMNKPELEKVISAHAHIHSLLLDELFLIHKR